MAEFNLVRLSQLLREHGEQDASVDVDLAGNIEDITFEDLGIDSLALFNTFVQIEREYTVELSYDVAVDAETPGELVKLVNEKLATGS
ncbi:acyl carrier protein [Streptomyces iranensis]|uniref:Act minimal PKS acyl carrier protein n=1 Tax=Streptomyces iranensis TaxID=576784 RepID=A0A060ZCW8_9ACTN|nr:acyl carrier protein [Streptomyces iranensis]MBP2067085.1 act minimal PKS acyl carrier protein [Streptomyces iranensis]CDR02673.1 phosphopantetheine-binding protein [Streptomyces iranensis]